MWAKYVGPRAKEFVGIHPDSDREPNSPPPTVLHTYASISMCEKLLLTVRKFDTLHNPLNIGLRYNISRIFRLHFGYVKNPMIKTCLILQHELTQIIGHEKMHGYPDKKSIYV